MYADAQSRDQSLQLLDGVIGLVFAHGRRLFPVVQPEKGGSCADVGSFRLLQNYPVFIFPVSDNLLPEQSTGIGYELT